MDWSFLNDAAPKQQEPEPVKTSGLANVTLRVDADCMMLCDGEYVEMPLKAGVMAKTALPVGQHLLEFISQENPNVKVEKVVDWGEADKNYLVIVNELKGAIPPQMSQPQQNVPQGNPFLDQLGQMAQMNPLAGINMGMPPMPQNTSYQNMPPMPEAPTSENNNNNQ